MIGGTGRPGPRFPFAVTIAGSRFPRPPNLNDASPARDDRIRTQVLRGLALNRIPGYHFPIHFLQLSFDRVGREATLLSLDPGPHCVDHTGHVHMGPLALLADLSMSASVRAGRDPSTRTATVTMTIHLTGEKPNGRLEAAGGQHDLLRGARGEQGATHFTMRSGGAVIAYGTGNFMVLDPPEGVKLMPVTMRKHGDPLPPDIVPSDLAPDEARVYAHAEESIGLAARERTAFIDRFWGARGGAGSTGELINGGHISNRVKHVQGGVLFGFAVSNAVRMLSGDGGEWITSSVTASFISPGGGDRMFANSEIVHRGGLTAVVRTAVTREDGKLVLYVTSTHASPA